MAALFVLNQMQVRPLRPSWPTIGNPNSVYMVTDEAVKEMVHLTMLLKDLGFTVAKPCGLWSDNAGAISLGVNPKLMQRSKHIDLCHHYVQKWWLRIEWP